MKKIEYIEDIAQWEAEFQFYSPVTVRFSETDMFGHMNNTVPFVYFEQARIDYFMEKGLLQEWLEPGSETIGVVADLKCDFLQQIYFGENLKVFAKLNSVGNSSVDIHYMVKNESDAICLTGRGAFVQISKKTGKAVPWTEELKRCFIEQERTIQQ